MINLLGRLREVALSDSILGRHIVEAPVLDEKDCRLVDEWAKANEGTDKEERDAKNLSARMAEKAVALFFENAGHQVKDVSIDEGNEGASDDWKSYDLLVESNPVDVKNTRPMFNAPRVVSWFVRSFKESSDGSPVAVFAALSKYRKPLFSDMRLPVTLLGSTSLRRIEELQGMLASGPLSGHVTSPAAGEGCFLPPWLFDFSPADYEKREEAFAAFRSQDWGRTAKDTCYFPTMALASGSSSFESESLPAATRRFAVLLRERLARYGLSLPVVFLTIFEHFIEQAGSGDEGLFDTAEISTLIFPDEPQSDSDLTLEGDRRRPLFLLDPTCIVSKLLEELRDHWPNRHKRPVTRDPSAYLNVQRLVSVR